MKKNFFNFEYFLVCAVTNSTSLSAKNATQEEQKASALIEIQNLHSLIDGYNTILYRFDEDSIKGRKFNNWNYDFTSSIGRPDRHRSKYTTSEAIDQLHNVDEIFPIYQKYFNVSYPSNDSPSDLREILNHRIVNIHETLKDLEEKYPSSGGGNLESMRIILSFLTVHVLVIKAF